MQNSLYINSPTSLNSPLRIESPSCLFTPLSSSKSKSFLNMYSSYSSGPSGVNESYSERKDKSDSNIKGSVSTNNLASAISSSKRNVIFASDTNLSFHLNNNPHNKAENYNANKILTNSVSFSSSKLNLSSVINSNELTESESKDGDSEEKKIDNNSLDHNSSNSDNDNDNDNTLVINEINSPENYDSKNFKKMLLFNNDQNSLKKLNQKAIEVSTNMTNLTSPSQQIEYVNSPILTNIYEFNNMNKTNDTTSPPLVIPLPIKVQQNDNCESLLDDHTTNYNNIKIENNKNIPISNDKKLNKNKPNVMKTRYPSSPSLSNPSLTSSPSIPNTPSPNTATTPNLKNFYQRDLKNPTVKKNRSSLNGTINSPNIKLIERKTKMNPLFSEKSNHRYTLGQVELFFTSNLDSSSAETNENNNKNNNITTTTINHSKNNLISSTNKNFISEVSLNNNGYDVELNVNNLPLQNKVK